MKRLILMVLASLFSLACRAELEKVEVIYDDVDERSLVRVDAQVNALQQASVSAKVTGQLLWVAELGQRVTKGQPIAEQDSTTLALEIARIKAMYQKTDHKIEYLQNDLSRLRSLESKQLVSQHLLDEAQLNLQLSKDELAILQAQLAKVEYELSQMTIRAPFDGIVARRSRSEGELISIGQEVIHLFNPKSNQIRARVDASLLARVDKSHTYSFDNKIQSDTAILVAVIPYVDDVTQTVEVIFKPKLAEMWMTGQHVTVRLPKAKKFSLSKRSVHKVGANNYVDVKREDRVVRLQVDVIEELPERVIVTGLLDEDDKVVIKRS